MTKQKSTVFAIDFDGTCTAHAFPYVGKEIGAPDVLRKLVDNGHKLILYTMRSDREKAKPTHDPLIMDVTGKFLTDAIRWFTHHGIELHGIQTNPTQHNWTTSPKCYAEIYIDDAALGAPLLYNPELSSKPYIDWKRVEEFLTINNYI